MCWPGYLFPTTGDNIISVQIVHDEWPRETSWTLLAQDGTVLRDQERGSVTEPFAFVSETMHVSAGTYTFTIEDKAGDGLCCSFGEGVYGVLVNDELVYYGDEFGYTSGDLVFVIAEDGSVTPTVGDE